MERIETRKGVKVSRRNFINTIFSVLVVIAIILICVMRIQEGHFKQRCIVAGFDDVNYLVLEEVYCIKAISYVSVLLSEVED